MRLWSLDFHSRGLEIGIAGAVLRWLRRRRVAAFSRLQV